MKTCTAVQLRVHDDAVAWAEACGIAAFDDFADHFMTHDSRIADRNGAAVDLEIGSTDAGVSDTHEHLACIETWLRNLVLCQLSRRGQYHGLHAGSSTLDLLFNSAR